MRMHAKSSLIALSVLLPLLAVAASAQMIHQPKNPLLSVPDAIQALQTAPADGKANARLDLVDSVNAVIATDGDKVLDPVRKVVEDRFAAKDPLYVVNCILALGEVKSKPSSDLLVTVLSDANLEYAYQAAVALGDIWEGAAASAPEVKAVSSALLALFCSDLPEPIIFGPGLAIIRINNLAVADPTRLSADDLRTQIDRWVTSNPAALPTLDQFPYQVLARIVEVGNDAAKNSALQALRQQRALGAIDPLLALMASGKAGSVAQGIGQLLGDLSGVPYPPAGLAAGATPQQTADAWDQIWLQALRTKTDDASRQYTRQRLENTLRHYAVGPDEALAKKVSDLYDTMLWQFRGPSDLPAGASAEARKLLDGPLGVKEKMARAVETLKSPPDKASVGTAISSLDTLLGDPAGPAVSRQFLPELVAVARKEADADSALSLGNILWRIAAVPLDLNGLTLEERQKQLDKWIDDVHKTKPGLNV